MLVACLVLPLAGAMVLALWRSCSAFVARGIALLAAAGPLLLLAAAWWPLDDDVLRDGALFAHVVDWPWIPALGAGFRLGVDGLSLPLAALSALLFFVAALVPTDYRGRARQYLAFLLFLEAASLGVFLALDLLLFYVCFDLSLVGMYFLIALWGHEERGRAALQFLLYTLLGSLVMLLGILSLVLASSPFTFHLRLLAEQQPLAHAGLRATVTVVAIVFGLAVKTPLVPVHSWLPSAHVEAPAPVSALLAGVLLKMGTYGMIRIAFATLEDAFRVVAPWLAVLAVVAIVYGALVALGQRHLKRRIAYTSITHMGYVVLGIAVATSLPSTLVGEAGVLALSGAALEMVAHGLLTGALFLVAGVLYRHTHTYAMDELGGVARRAPWLTAFAVVAAFGSLGLPGLAGFVAELQVFAGAVALAPWLAGVSLLGVLLTAALLLDVLQGVFFGRASGAGPSGEGPLPRDLDVNGPEGLALFALLFFAVVVGVAPAFVLDPLASFARALLGAF